MTLIDQLINFSIKTFVRIIEHRIIWYYSDNLMTTETYAEKLDTFVKLIFLD